MKNYGRNAASEKFVKSYGNLTVLKDISFHVKKER